MATKKVKKNSKAITVHNVETVEVKEIKPIHPMAVMKCEINFDTEAIKQLMIKHGATKLLD